MKNRIILILPYFGKLPNFFPFWLQSCVNNKDIDFLIITDNENLEVSSYKNIFKVTMTFDDCRAIIEEKLKRRVLLERPYKLCDYRPLYGKIFEDYIEGYEFWGFCDCDMIFGDISKFTLIPQHYNLTLFISSWATFCCSGTYPKIRNYHSIHD